jgi:hypothetical protein
MQIAEQDEASEWLNGTSLGFQGLGSVKETEGGDEGSDCFDKRDTVLQE